MSSVSLPLSSERPRTSPRFQSPVVVLREDEVENIDASVRELAGALGISKVTAKVLVSRGLSEAGSVQQFLAPTLKEHLPDPGEMKNLQRAAEAILDSIQREDTIAIYSDFDVDGLTSSAQLVLFLKELGARVISYVPNRFIEGYGLSIAGVDAVVALGADLLVTADCGISNVLEISHARKKGLRTIVLDHHIPGPELPPADVVVDPAQDGCPFGEHKLAAAGIVWMLLILLRAEAKKRGLGEGKTLPDPKDYLDLAAIGTICDMVPLRGLNRLIAHRGVDALRRPRRVGIEALKEVSGVQQNRRFGSGQVAFALGPRINAAGRLGDANEVVSLLTTRDSKKARRVADSINKLNDKRRLIENQVKESCIERLSANSDPQSRAALTVYGEEYHLGVIGIAAQRLVEEYYRPAAVMGPGETVYKGKKIPVIKGSVRGISGFHVAEVLSELGELLLAHGGHAQAGGFTLVPENLEAFQAGFSAAASRCLSEEQLRRTLHADVRISLSEVDYDLANELLQLAPFGVGNPSPLLVSEEVRVDSVTLIKDKHLRVRLADGRCSRNAVAWNMQGHPLLRKDNIVHVAYHVELNTYQGVSSVQLQIKEVWT